MRVRRRSDARASRCPGARDLAERADGRRWLVRPGRILERRSLRVRRRLRRRLAAFVARRIVWRSGGDRRRMRRPHSCDSNRPSREQQPGRHDHDGRAKRRATRSRTLRGRGDGLHDRLDATGGRRRRSLGRGARRRNGRDRRRRSIGRDCGDGERDVGARAWLRSGCWRGRLANERWRRRRRRRRLRGRSLHDGIEIDEAAVVTCCTSGHP